MKEIKYFLKKFDIFAVPFSFRYNNEDKYSTSLGGLFFIAFCAVVTGVGIYYFIPFFKRKNFSIVYYSMNLPDTEQIRLKDSKTSFGVGFECEVGNDGTKAEDILDLSLKYYTFRKDKDGNKIKTYDVLSTHPCNYSDFYNSYNDSVDLLGMDAYHCLDKTDDVIEGIYTDEVFSYYMFSVTAKNDSESNFNKIDNYLTDNDCKLSIYYTDTTIDIDNYEEPIHSFLNQIFLQMNPTLYLKMNVFFMRQYFENDNYLLSVLGEEEPNIKVLFSRAEQYSLYKGLNRHERKPSDYKNYAKIYVRADSKKSVIKRKYQKIIEFYADSSSLLMALFEILRIIFNCINSFYADHSFTKHLFFFKEVDDNNHLDNNIRHRQIKELIALTGPISKKLSKKNLTPFESKNIQTSLVKETEWIKNLEKGDVNLYNRKKLKRIKFQENEQLSTEKKLNNELEYNENKKKKNIKILKKVFKETCTSLELKSKEKEKEKEKEIKPTYNLPTVQINIQKNEIASKSNLIDAKYPVQRRPQEEIVMENPKFKKIKFTYNVFEIFISSFLCCFMTRRLRLKKILTEKANNILYKKLDIVLFIRNMILLDIMNESILNDNNNRKGIIKFLSRPIISISKDEGSEFDDFYKRYSLKDFDTLYEQTSELVRKSEKLEMEKKLIFISNQQLKKLVYK